MNDRDDVLVNSDEIASSSNVFTQKPHTINPIVYMCKNFLEFIWKIVYWLIDLVVSMFSSIWHFLKIAGIGIVKGAIGIYKFFQRKCHQFKYNDKYGRLSFVFFGSSSFAHKQYTNGVLYILFEVLYIVFFAIFGVHSIYMLGTLGVAEPGLYPEGCDPLLDDLCEWRNGDNSIMILIYGLLWVFSIVLFIYIWNRNINAGYNNYRIQKFVEFDKVTKNCEELGKQIDAKVQIAFAKGVKKSAFLSENLAEINSFLEKIEDKTERDYSKYLLLNAVSYAYQYQKDLARHEKRLEKLNARKEKSLAHYNAELEKVIASCEEAKLEHAEDYEYLDKLDVKVERAKNNCTSKSNRWNKTIKEQEHRIFEFKKTHANFVSVQNVRNNKHYGRYNDYYNHLEKLEVQLQFFTHYRELIDTYNSNLNKEAEINEANAKLILDYEKEMNDKIAATKEKFEKIRARRSEIEGELAQVKANYNAKVKEIKASGGEDKEVLLNDAKLVLIEETTRLRRMLNDLPTEKNVNLLEKEEIRESREAYRRDKKYCRTNYTSEAYAYECVNNKMIVDYKLDFKQTKDFVSKYLRPDRILADKVVDEKVRTLTEEKENYIKTNTSKFVGRSKSFKETVSGLLNENFHISILSLPIAGILFFTIMPLAFSILIAFTNYSVGHVPPTQLFTWIGLENFQNLLFPAENSVYAVLPRALLRTVGWTFTWAIFATFTNYILGIIVALMINKDGIKLKRLWRTIFILTIAIPQFISLLSIGTLLKDTGAIGTLVQQWFGTRLGFGTDNSDGGVLMAKIIIIVVNVWVGIPYTILSTTGILLNIPKDLYESARVDGAGTLTQFTKITMPYILFVTGPYLITQFIGNINNFNVIFFLTGGGPSIRGSGLLGLGETDLLITFLYKIVTSTNNPQYGIASAVGIIIFIICSFVSIVMYNKSGAIKEEDQFQ